MYELAPDYMGLFVFSRRGSYIADSGAEVNSFIFQRQGILAALDFRSELLHVGMDLVLYSVVSSCCIQLRVSDCTISLRVLAVSCLGFRASRVWGSGLGFQGLGFRNSTDPGIPCCTMIWRQISPALRST